ncbi:MAG: hypothetical protein D6760_07100, partial [Deltaproteobacteria bacterium]
YREHPTAFHDRLMSWYQKRSCTDAEGNDSATDGDLDIAYALLLADRQWGSCGAVDYASEAAAMLGDLADGDFASGAAPYPLLGDWVSPANPTYYAATRTSDFMPGHLRAFAANDPAGPWLAAVDLEYAIVAAVQNTYSPATGLLPDFVIDPAGAPAPASPNFLEAPTDGTYSYNACRDPWRLGVDYLVSGDSRAKAALDRISSWFSAATAGDPSAIGAGYALDGTPTPGTDYSSMAFVAPLGVAAMAGAAGQPWLDALWSRITEVPIEAEGYYENTLKLLSMIAISGNWWSPEVVAPAPCTPPGNTLCTGGGYIPAALAKIAKWEPPAGDERIKLRASLFFPNPAAAAGSLSSGGQIRIEDAAVGTPLFDLTVATTPIPGETSASCDARDRWKLRPGKAVYVNKSGALDWPACTPGSARGLAKVVLRRRSSRDIDVKIVTRSTSFSHTGGAVRITFVLGPAAEDGNAGACAISAPISCQPRGRSLRCF